MTSACLLGKDQRGGKAKKGKEKSLARYQNSLIEKQPSSPVSTTALRTRPSLRAALSILRAARRVPSP